MSDTDAEKRAVNREWIAGASSEQLRDLAFWLNAFNPMVFAVAIEDSAEDAGEFE